MVEGEEIMLRKGNTRKEEKGEGQEGVNGGKLKKGEK